MARPANLRQQLLEALRRQILQGYRPGERISGQRNLAAIHGVGQATVHRALTTLAEEGLIEARPQEGWYRTPLTTRQRSGSMRSPKKKNQKLKRIGIITRRGETEWRSTQLMMALNNAAEKRGLEVVMCTNPRRSHPTPARNRLDLERIPWNRFDVGLLAEVEDWVTLQDPILKRHPVLAVDRDTTAFGLPCVTFNDREVGATVARLFWDQGHRRFALTDELCDEGWPVEASWLARRQGFEEEIGRRGGAIRVDWRVPGGRHRNLSRGKGKGLINQQRVAERWAQAESWDRPTAIFATNPAELGAFFKALEGHFGRAGKRSELKLEMGTVTWDLGSRDVFAPYSRWVRHTVILLDLGSLVDRALDRATVLFEKWGQKDKDPQVPTLEWVDALRIVRK